METQCGACAKGIGLQGAVGDFSAHFHWWGCKVEAARGESLCFLDMLLCANGLSDVLRSKIGLKYPQEP